MGMHLKKFISDVKKSIPRHLSLGHKLCSVDAQRQSTEKKNTLPVKYGFCVRAILYFIS